MIVPTNPYQPGLFQRLAVVDLALSSIQVAPMFGSFLLQHPYSRCTHVGTIPDEGERVTVCTKQQS